MEEKPVEWSPKKWREEVENLALEMFLGAKLAKTVGTLLVDNFDEDYRPVKLATAAFTLKLLKYKIKEEEKALIPRIYSADN